MGNNARIIGITGAMGAGKGTVAKLLEEKKAYTLLNLDHIAHECLSELKTQLVCIFGKNILSTSGKVNRRVLGKIVFQSPVLLQKLESLVHPLLTHKVKCYLKASEEKKFILDGALLYKLKLDIYCHKILVIKSCLLIRLFRLCLKRRLPLFYVLKILKRQRKLVPKNTKNVIIVNNGSLKSLSKTLQNLKLF